MPPTFILTQKTDRDDTTKYTMTRGVSDEEAERRAEERRDEKDIC